MEIKNVFISHIHNDDVRLNQLKSLTAVKGYQLRDGSITNEKPNKAEAPDYIKQGILAPQIKWAGTMLVLISADTYKSEWVNWEIEYANKQGMRIVGIWDDGESDATLPESFQKYGDALVGWRGDRLIDAIEGNIENMEDSSGVTYTATSIVRYGC